MTGEHDGFDDTDGASDELLRALLHTGDPQQRVWAAWRLALRQNQRARTQIRTELERTRDVGVRRNMLIVLAGLGEREVLRVLAEDEPEPLLRGEASVLVWRTAVDRAEVVDFVRRRLDAETDSDVLLRLLTLSPPLETAEIVSSLAGVATRARGVETRRTAWELLLAERGSSPTIEWHRILDEPDDALRQWVLARWAASDRHGELLAAARRSPSTRVDLLVTLRDCGRRYHWDDLETLRDVDALWYEVVELLVGPYPEDARRWLYDSTRLSSAPPHEWGYDPTAWEHMRLAYAEIVPHGLTELDLEVADRIERAVRQFDADNPNYDDDDDEMWCERLVLIALRRDPGRWRS
ncbi:hypothetical protein [Paraliomyxa miuraensis]|uniref:hypothetical protein n=1 Tax=Paraliomyxa miuraensis TaxID=376150 RepID=UPI0022554D91|nr:hypothetical protein [Paraliomyxa miuraensis]MCX4247650.1 hypothetical protein [Paraliomyxa miuraensis]